MTKTLILMAAITALFVYVGGALGGPQGMMFALIFAICMNFFSYWNSDKIVLKKVRVNNLIKMSQTGTYPT